MTPATAAAQVLPGVNDSRWPLNSVGCFLTPDGHYIGLAGFQSLFFYRVLPVASIIELWPRGQPLCALCSGGCGTSRDPAALASFLADVFREKPAFLSKGCCGYALLKSTLVPGQCLLQRNA